MLLQTLLNRAYSTREKELQFEVSSDHTANRRSSGGSMDSKVVPCITLRELIAENRIQKYTLVSDVEGSEIEFLMEEEEALRGCQMMIIELHRGVYEGQQLEVADLRRIIVEKLNFKVVQEHGRLASTQEFDQRLSERSESCCTSGFWSR